MRINRILAGTVMIPVLTTLELVAAGTSCGPWSKNQYGRDLLPTATLVEYFTGNDAGPNDPRCTGHNCSLRGWLYTPDPFYSCPPVAHAGTLSDTAPCFGLTRHPAIVFNQGHEQDPSEICAIADFFTGHGYVVFSPQRRGTTDVTTGRLNTGTFIDQCVVPNSTPGADVDYPKDSEKELTCLMDQVKEVDSALHYLATKVSSVDPSRIALMGHSFGGSLTLYAASSSLSTHPKAAIDISGATLSWDHNRFYQLIIIPPGLPYAVIGRKMPIFFLQPSNEANLEPTLQLSGWAGRSGDRMFEAAFYPPVLPDANQCLMHPDRCVGPRALINKTVHSRFVTRAEHINSWGVTALDFLKRYGVH